MGQNAVIGVFLGRGVVSGTSVCMLPRKKASSMRPTMVSDTRTPDLVPGHWASQRLRKGDKNIRRAGNQALATPSHPVAEGRLHVSGTSFAWPQKTHRPPLFARLRNTLPNPLGCRPHPSPTPSATRSFHPICAAGPWAEPETGPGPFLLLETIPLPRPISGHALQSRTLRTVCGGTHRSHPSLNLADGHLRAEDISASRKPGPPYPSRLPGLEHAAQ